ncbi:MAG: hypothetical protein QXX16_02590 [Nitrososphaerota archaeon]
MSREEVRISFVAEDRATPSIKTVSEAVKELGESNETVKRMAADVVRESREQRQILRAIAEESQIFGERAQFVAGQLNNIAALGSRTLSLFNAWNTAMTRVNTAQLALSEAHERYEQALNRFLSAGSVEESIKAQRELEKAEKDLEKATRSLEDAQRDAQMQVVAMGVSLVGLVPQGIQAANSLAALAKTVPMMVGGINSLKVSFMGLNVALGPIGIALTAIGALIAAYETNFLGFRDAVNSLGRAIGDFFGPVLSWVMENVLKPLAEFLASVFQKSIQVVISMLDVFSSAGRSLGDALTWLWEKVLRPLGEFIAGLFINYVKSWIQAFEWAQESIKKIWEAITRVIKSAIDTITGWIEGLTKSVKDAFKWLHDTLVGHSVVPDMWRGIISWYDWGTRKTMSMLEDLRRDTITVIEMDNPLTMPQPRVNNISLTIKVNVAQPLGENNWEMLAEKLGATIMRRLRGVI